MRFFDRLCGVAKRPRRRAALTRCRLRCECLDARTVPAITLQFDFSLDANNFFDTQAKKDLLIQAGHIVADKFGDSLSAIVPGNGNTWSAILENPATGASKTLDNLVVPGDTVILFAGGRDLANSEAGVGGPGGFSAGSLHDPNWIPLIESRGQPGAFNTPPTDFGPATGFVAFDTVGTPWYFGSDTTLLLPAQLDFLSVAEHEIAHALGFGTADSWFGHVQAASGTFNGPASAASFGGNVPLSPDHSHWADGVTSGGDETAMDPVTTEGVRKNLTPLDYAGLSDVGWQILTGGVTVSPTSGLVTSETGGTATFTVVLTSVPTANVAISLHSSDLTEGRVSPTTLTFTPADALTPQTVTVTGVHDNIPDGDQQYTIVLDPVVSADPGYNGLKPADVSATNLDNGGGSDTAPVANDDKFELGSSTASTAGTTSVLDNDADAEGDILTAVVVTQPALGTVTLNASGGFTYAGGVNFWGVDTFTYKANDGLLDSNAATVTVMTQNAFEVRKLYLQVLGREPEVGGWQFWTNALNNHAASLGTLASSIFESDERLDPIIQQMYQTYLLRPADSDGLSFWKGIWRRDGGPDTVIAGIVSSPEFFQSVGSDNGNWVTEMYRRLLNREPDQAGHDFWSGVLNRQQLDRFGVVLFFVRSDENFRNLVNGWFQEYLNRTPSTAEQNNYLFALEHGGWTQRMAQINIINGPEYLNTPPPPAAGVALRVT
jgi:hypothetical protein